jgi:recombination protein RecR
VNLLLNNQFSYLLLQFAKSPETDKKSMAELTETVMKMMREFEKLPGIGKKSAERIAYHLLKIEKDKVLVLADAIREVKEKVRYCRECYNLAEEEVCGICQNTRRDTSLLCVVEQPRDLISLEQTGIYNGLYHVLLGRIAPLDQIGPEQLTIGALVHRVKNGQFKEIVMATNPTVEGDGTALFIMNQLEGLPVKITRLARGITSGNDLQFANKEMLSDALLERQTYRND